MSEKKFCRAGFTLIEMLITIFIFLLIAGILFMMLIKSKTAMQSSITRSSSRQDLQVVSWKIAQDLRYSDVKFITDGSLSGLKAFSFISAEDSTNKFVLNTDGTPAWQKYVIYYVPAGTTKLLRKEVYVNFKANPDALAPLPTAQLSAHLDGTGSWIASSMISIKLSPSPAGESAADLVMETQAQNQHGQLDKQSRQMTVYIVN